ncbi:hypothetical protein [Nonomuraea candida]|uniref:hypothetical protein n=1 Tax=Nonomuraea candida TaxID=359159 RepID=UPI0012F7962A|nr:hypothetical protein [Nonomuraea candida]
MARSRVAGKGEEAGVEESGRRDRRRHAAGHRATARHISDGPTPDDDLAGSPATGRGRAGRHARRHPRRRARRARLPGGARWVAGVVALAGGVVVLLSANGSIGAPGGLMGLGAQETPRTGAGPAHQPGAGPGSGTAGPAGPDGTTGPGGAVALPGGGDGRGEPRAGLHADAQVRSRQSQRAEASGPVDAPKGAAGPGTVAGTTAPEDVPAGEPDPEDGDGHKADGFSRHTDQQAAHFFRTNWGPGDKALKRLRDIRTVGGYLRIYTDLPEDADNSHTAITLCERGLAYLRSRGVAEPVVFVQAEFGGNGNPVLANILGSADRSCKVTHPPPD